MVDLGIDSKMLCLHKSKLKENTVIKYSDSIIHKVLRSSRLPINKYIRNERILKARGGIYESFSFIESDYLIHKHPLVREADIINLHLINGFTDYIKFFGNVHKPIFWTLHDMNPFMGGFHYMNDFVRNQETLGDIETTLRNEKFHIYSKCNNLVIIALNRWMFKLSINSEHFRDKTHFIIPNTLNINVFKHYNKFEQRNKFGLPVEKTIFLFVSFSIDNHRKGGDILKQAFDIIKTDNIVYCQVGQSNMVRGTDKLILNLGAISDESIMARLYSAVDAVIIPSSEDNLPNVLLEALTCGTPVICTPVGGCPDYVENQINGLITKDFSSESMAEAIEYFVEIHDSFDSDIIRANALQKFSPEIVVNKYLEAYGMR
jgi:glycosyltransferase involved in cell wall biosynthesis